MAKVKSEEIEFKEIPYTILSQNFYSSRDTLKRIEVLLKNGKLNQTLLISGPPSVGKTTLAYIIAAALQCENPTPFACGKCLNCRKIKKGIFPDLRYITLKEGENGKLRTQILIEQVREDILKVADLPPYEGKKLVFIIEPAEGLNISSQNALLKILEEPPSYVQFILIAKEKSRLLPTVKSRCQEISLKELNFEESLKIAQKLGQKENAIKAAEASRGRVGLIVSGGWEEYLQLKEILEKLIILGGDIKYYNDVSIKIEELSKYPVNLVFDETLYIIKEMIKSKEGFQSLYSKKENFENVSKEQLFKKVNKTLEATEMVNRNVNTKLIFNYIFLGE